MAKIVLFNMGLSDKVGLRDAALSDILQEMSEYGPARDWSILWRSRYPEVKKTTWYRWVDKVKSSGVAAKQAAKAVKAQARDDIEHHLADTMPVIVTPDDVSRSGIIPVMRQIQKAIERANKVIAMYETEDGRIRNPKVYLLASRHALEALRTASQIADQLMDAQNTERFHTAVLECIKEADPKLAQSVVRRLKELNHSWGVRLPS